MRAGILMATLALMAGHAEAKSLNVTRPWVSFDVHFESCQTVGSDSEGVPTLIPAGELQGSCSMTGTTITCELRQSKEDEPWSMSFQRERWTTKRGWRATSPGHELVLIKEGKGQISLVASSSDPATLQGIPTVLLCTGTAHDRSGDRPPKRQATSPTRSDIASAIRRVKPDIEACGASLDQRLRVKTVFRVEPSGHLADIEVREVSEALRHCVRKALQRAVFVRTEKGAKVRYPFILGGSKPSARGRNR